MVSQITVLAVIAMAGVAMGNTCFCPMVYSPVCASNGQTFSNKCLVNCHNVEKNDMNLCGDLFPFITEKSCSQRKMMPTDLVVVNRGHCRGSPQLNKKIVQEKPEDLCLCTKEYVPVCGSNLKTYSNRCVFNCAARKDKSLRILYPMICIIMP